jgi:DHA1 family tetracycline resistance protein-like MFS transporter
MFFAAAITLVSIALVIFFLPESISKKPEKLSLSFDVIPANEVKDFAKNPNVRNILLLFFVYNVGFFLFISNFGLLAESLLGVTADQVSFYMAWIGILRVSIQTFLIAYLLRALGEHRLLVTGLVSMTLSMALLAFSADYLFVFLPLVFLAYGTGVARPILTSTMTNSVTQNETATLLGVNNSLTSIAQIITPIVGGFMIEYLPSQTLSILSAVIFASTLLFIKNRTNL